MKTTLFVALILFLANSTIAMAQVAPLDASRNEGYLQVSSINTKLIGIEEKELSNNELLQLNADNGDFSPYTFPSLTPEGSDPMAIADIFFKVWDIIKDGAPIVNAEYKNVTALPNIAQTKWEALTGWKSERTLIFGTSVKNLYGMTTVDLEYKVKLLFGGGLKGKGQYIASARVVPSKVKVLWGYNLDVSVEVPSILNVASLEDPIAAINLDVTYKIHTMMKSYSESNSYELQGDGLMKADGKVLCEAVSR